MISELHIVARPYRALNNLILTLTSNPSLNPDPVAEYLGSDTLRCTLIQSDAVNRVTASPDQQL